MFRFVARGPVPREPSAVLKQDGQDLQDLQDEARLQSAQTQRSALGKRAYLINTVARGPVPRKRRRSNMARDRPSPYDKGKGYRRARACPSRTFNCLKQDGQDEQDEQDEAAGTPKTGLADLNGYRDATITRRKGPADLNVYRTSAQHGEKVHRTLMSIEKFAI